MFTTEQRVETVARLVHELRHRAGTGQVCSECRALAERIDRLYRQAYL